MRSRILRGLGSGLMAAGLMALLLSGCSSTSGTSAFGSNKLAVAELSDPGSYTAESALASAKASFRNNDFGNAAALYKRAAELGPKNPDAFVGLAASYDRLRRFDLSDRVYASLFELTGGTVQYFNNVGYSYLLRGNLSAALTNFRKAGKLDPDNLVVANNIQIVANAAKQIKA